jgi:DNA-directed RNA polymerase sigma subunit (sigma70/sigma32)
VAKQVLADRNLGLVHKAVRARIGSRRCRPGLYEELVQEGVLGLMRATELYDPSKGHRFSTYAYAWIKGVLSNSKANQIITVPTRERSLYNKIRAAREELGQAKLSATALAIGEQAGVSVGEVERCQMGMKAASCVVSAWVGEGRGERGRRRVR